MPANEPELFVMAGGGTGGHVIPAIAVAREVCRMGHRVLFVGTERGVENRLAPAAVLSPFIYTEILLVIALGFLVFGDLPKPWTLAGAAIVIASGLYLLHREHAARGDV